MSKEISKPDFSGITVLYVDDDQNNLDYISAVLTGTGINYLSAKNGLEAVKICESNNLIDLILMDIKMPFMDGYEATMEIKKRKPEQKIVCLTACTWTDSEEQALRAGCDGFYTKPIIREDLYSLICSFVK